MIRVEIVNAHPRRRPRKGPLEKAVRGVLRREGCTAAAVRIVLIDHRRCIRMNNEFLKHRGTTDVITFPLTEGRELEGEVYVNVDQALVQAEQYAVSGINETVRLVVHGTLHLLGYDDTTAALRRIMKVREDAYTALLAPKEG
jgi:probable rRNA maturation factor